MNKLNDLDIPEVVGLPEVARWLGTTPSAVGNWVHRYATVPHPVCKQKTAQGSRYFWAQDSKQEWVDWAMTEDVWALVDA
jgi:hypothetical protein